MMLKKYFLWTILLLLTFTGMQFSVEAVNLNDSNPINLNFGAQVNFFDIDNFHKIDNNFYRGAQPDNDDISSLDNLGIKTIINLRGNPENFSNQKKQAESLGINYLNIPMNPFKPPTNDQIAYFFNIVNSPENLPVFIHCRQGKDRTGIMTALYRVNNYGWDFAKAYEEMKQKGYHRFIYPRQKKFLYAYVKVLNSLKLPSYAR